MKMIFNALKIFSRTYYCKNCYNDFKLSERSFKFSLQKKTFILCCPYCKNSQNLIKLDENR